RRAMELARSATLDATTRAQAALAAAIAANDGPSAVPNPAPTSTCLQVGGTACVLRVTTIVSFAAPQPAPLASAASCPNQACTSYWQANDRVAESRSDASITAIVTSPTHAVIARRDLDVRFRTIAVPPFAILVGSLDLRIDGIAANHIGDDGGSLGTIGEGTLIDVVYQNARTAVRTPANVWDAHSFSAASVTTAWDP
ncbi:MAG: hypothetical protein ACYDGM_12920, partial [Vulcanimicrobiaceae bacterium]